MSLLDQMAADLDAVFLAADGLAQDARLVAAGTDGAGTALRALFGDAVATAAFVIGDAVDRRTARVLCARASARAAVRAQTGAERDLTKGDRFTVASGAWAGSWIVSGPASEDEGGGLMVDCAREDLAEAAGPGVLETR